VLAYIKVVKGILTHLLYLLVTVTVHYKEGRIPRTFLLDIVECAESHMRATLVVTLVNIIDNFGISDKVWLI